MKIKHLLTKTLLVAAGLFVGTSAWADTVNGTLVHTASLCRNNTSSPAYSLDAEKEHYNTLASGAWQGFAYAEFSFVIPSGHSVTNATLSWTTLIGGKNNNNRDNNVSYVNVGNTIDYNGFSSVGNAGVNAYASGVTLIENKVLTGKTEHSTTTDVTSAIQTMVANNQTYIIFQWTNNGAGADLYGKGSSTKQPTLVITTTNEVLYTATFVEGSSLNPSITIYTDAGRTSEIANGQLHASTTYYYRAVLAGYENYEGSFAVETSNPTVNFTMTSLPRYTFTVNAVNSVGSAVIKALYTDNDSYDGKVQPLYFPKYLTGEGNIVTYSKDDNTYYQEFVSASGDATKTISYTAYDGVAYFVEVEDVVSATGYESANCSNGHAVRGFTTAKPIFTIPATGRYDITYAICNNNVSYALECVLSKNGTPIATKEDLQYISINYIKTTGIVENNNVSLEKGDVLNLTPSSTNGVVDYMLIELKTIPTTIATSGYSTISSSYALDFANATDGSSNKTLKAYTVSNLSETSATLSEVTQAPANTGIILMGTAGETYNIPVLASASAVGTNYLHAAVTATTLADASFYVLKGGKFLLVKGTADEAARTVPAGKAYLLASDMPAPELALDFGDVTGIADIRSKMEEVRGDIFDLQGRKVAQPTKGLYIQNGRKVILK